MGRNYIPKVSYLELLLRYRKVRTFYYHDSNPATIFWWSLSTLTRRFAAPSPSGRGTSFRSFPLPLGEGAAKRRVRVERLPPARLRPSQFVLEEILQSKLHDARIFGRCDLAEIAAVQVNCRIVLNEAVRHVECFRAELHPLCFTNLKRT